MLNFPRFPFNRRFANNINLRFSLPSLECSSYLAIVEAYIQCQKRKTVFVIAWFFRKKAVFQQ